LAVASLNQHKIFKQRIEFDFEPPFTLYLPYLSEIDCPDQFYGEKKFKDIKDIVITKLTKFRPLNFKD
jgi:hypothetical protein